MSVYKNYSCDTQEEREKRFDSFLNKTIVMSSKRYFKKENNIGTKEKTIVDNADFCDFLQGFIDVENSCFDDVENKLQLNSALNTLSVVEQATRELSKSKHLSNENYRKWNYSAYKYNPSRKRYEFDEKLGRSIDVPKYIKER